MNGQIIDTEIVGLTLSSTGPLTAPVIFDSQIVQGGDPDLNGPPWDSGNIVNAQLGNLLIVQENGNDCDAFFCDPPDDNANGGTVTFDFGTTGICSFGFDGIDIEGSGSFGDITFFNNNGQVATRTFESLSGPAPGITFGDNSANRFTPLTAAILGVSQFDEVRITHDGSGAVDNITFQECDVIGGHGKVMDKTSLLVSGAQLTSSWMIPLLVSSIGIGVFVVTRK